MWDIPWPQVLGIGSGWALFAFAGYSIIKGWLVPRSTVDFLAAERDQRLLDMREEADQWRSVATLSQQELGLLREQGDELLEQSKVTVVLLEDIKNQAS